MTHAIALYGSAVATCILFTGIVFQLERLLDLTNHHKGG